MVIIERLEAGWRTGAVALAFGIDAKTVRKWRERYQAHGAARLQDRSSHSSPSRLDAAARSEIEALRHQRPSAPAMQGDEDAVGELVLAEILPDILDGVELGRAGRQQDDGQVSSGA